MIWLLYPLLLLLPAPGTYGASTYGQNLQHTEGASWPTKSAAHTQEPRKRIIPTGFDDLVPPVMQSELPSGAQETRLVCVVCVRGGGGERGERREEREEWEEEREGGREGRGRERKRYSECVCEWVCVSECVWESLCACVCVCACVYACILMWMCVCVWERELLLRIVTMRVCFHASLFTCVGNNALIIIPWLLYNIAVTTIWFYRDYRKILPSLKYNYIVTTVEYYRHYNIITP